MNPCPCGFYGDPFKACSCSSGTVTKYQRRISGPLMDRIDIHVDVPRVDYEKLSETRLGESSESVSRRVEAARQVQRERFMGSSLTCNADMHPAQVRQYCALDDPCRSLMRAAMNQLQLSARAYHRILKLHAPSPTYNEDIIKPLAEALISSAGKRYLRKVRVGERAIVPTKTWGKTRVSFSYMPRIPVRNEFPVLFLPPV